MGYRLCPKGVNFRLAKLFQLLDSLFELLNLCHKGKNRLLQLLNVLPHRFGRLEPVRFRKWSFYFHGRKHNMLEIKNLGLFLIISACYIVIEFACHFK